MHDWTSPILGIRFDLSGEELLLDHPDGSPFRTHAEIRRDAIEAQELAYQRELEAKKAAAAAQKMIKQRDEEVKEAHRKQELFAQKLREQGIDPDSILGN